MAEGTEALLPEALGAPRSCSDPRIITRGEEADWGEAHGGGEYEGRRIVDSRASRALMCAAALEAAARFASAWCAMATAAAVMPSTSSPSGPPPVCIRKTQKLLLHFPWASRAFREEGLGRPGHDARRKEGVVFKPHLGTRCWIYSTGWYAL